MSEGSESKYYNNSRFPGPGGAAQAARHILGPKAKQLSVYQRNLTLMERTMPESRVKALESVEINGSSPCTFLGCVCGLANFVIPVRC